MREVDEPLVPPDVDLRGLEWMPYYGDRLSRSGFNAIAGDDVWRAAHNLWWSAWNSVPAGSLPDDDNALTRYADLGRDMRSFRRIKQFALHGFVKCRSDGRLYHPFLCKLALEAWERRVRDRARKARWRGGQNGSGDADRDVDAASVTGAVPVSGTDDRTGQDRTGQDRTGGRVVAVRGRRLPDDWQPDLTDRLFAEQLSLDPDEIAAKFRDYWHARAGAGGTKLDWPATWRTWCRREAEDRNRRGPHGSTARTNGSGRPANGFVELELEAQRRAEARDRGRDEHPADR